MDKHETKWLTFSFRLILIGILFWVIKPQIVTRFFLPPTNFINLFGVEIIGTLLIFAGLFITQRTYPFFWTFFAEGFCLIVLAMNVLHIFFYGNPIYKQINYYDTFFMLLCSFFICKLFENGLQYFCGPSLARKWRYFAIIIFFGFAVPCYLLTTLYICDVIKPEHFAWTGKLICLLIPFIITELSAIIFYLFYLVKSFRFLSDIQKKNEDK